MEMRWHTKLNRNVAYEEVVARLRESFLTDIHLSDKVGALYKTDRSLCEKILDFLRDIGQKIKAAFAGAKPQSELGRIGREIAQKHSGVLDLFIEGVRKASENLAYTESSSGVLNMAREQTDEMRLRNELSEYEKFTELSEAGQQETLGILLALAGGQHISLARINAMELLFDAFARRGELSVTININTPQRERLRQEVQERVEKLGSAVEKNGKIVYSGNINRDHRADIVIGLPSAGKSSVVADPLSALYGSRIVDSDIVKELLPEFNNGLGAGNVHEESKRINAIVLANAISKGENIVLPIVGSNADKVLSTINVFKQNGYDVYLHLNELPMYKALGRMIRRYIETGRFLAPKLIFDYQNNPTNVFEQMVNEQGGLLSGYSRYSNDVEKGKKPIFKGGTEDYNAAFAGRHNENLEAGSEDIRSGRDRLLERNGLNGVTAKQQNKKNQSRDADYLSAVERGDMETAQRMVDEAAKAAGYTIKAYHGTGEDFTVFDLSKSGSNSRELVGDTAEGMFFFAGIQSAYPGSAQDYAQIAKKRTGNAYIKATPHNLMHASCRLIVSPYCPKISTHTPVCELIICPI